MATVMQKIKDIEDEMARTQKNKATAHHLGLLKAKLAKLRREDLEPSTKGAGGAGEGFDVTKSGDARVGLVGFPSVGKSTLLNKLTGTFSEVENPPFCLQYILRWGLPDPIMGKWKGTSEMVLVDFRSLLIFSAFLRVALIVYGEWQDAHMDIRYTDIDYLVFSDAALLMASGESPYKRTTYRYSPLLAFLMIPNSIVHHSWGKFIFSASDLLVGVFIRTILNLRKVPENLCTYSVVVWLFNPFTFTIGTRGNCEPIVCAIILWVVICLMKGNFLQASFWYGFVVHFRIYPIIYALPLVLVLDPDCFRYGRKPIIGNWISFQVKASDTGSAIKCNWCYALRSIFSNERILFGLISATVFFFFTGLFFYLYEWEFLHEALLYHLTRTDPRHNFSIYFYHIYLQFENTISVIEKLVAFFPQFLVQSVLIFCFARDLLFCMFVQTVAFVAFNKVITAQYFVWFFCLFPVILPWCKMRLKWKGLCCIAVWIGAQLHWLLWGYLLEFKGMNVFLQLWVAGLVFLAANTSVLLMIIRDHRYSPIFKSLDKKSS